MVLGQPLGDIERRGSLAKSGDGFGDGCRTWGRKTSCVLIQNGPDQLFRLVGTIGSVSPNAYGDSDTHSNGKTADHTDAQAASDAGAETVIRERSITTTA
jgi:hypothetical protein